MGATFEINTLEEMCDLMCDNKVPSKKEGKDAMDREEIRICVAKQMTFIGDLTTKLAMDMSRDLEQKPLWSWHIIANKTQLIADARRIRRELSELIKLLQEEPE